MEFSLPWEIECEVETIRHNTESMRLAEKLHKLMSARDLPTIAEVARRAKVSRSSCYKWFEGTALPNVHEALRLAQLFGVPLDYLADDSQDQPPSPRPEEASSYVRLVLRTYRRLRDRMGEEDAVGLIDSLIPMMDRIKEAGLGPEGGGAEIPLYVERVGPEPPKREQRKHG